MHVTIPGTAHLELFAAAALLLLVIPGPAVLYLTGRSIEQGLRGGLVSIAGIHTGTLVHVAAATLGLSAILASSALAFAIVKYAGATYLIWLGVRRILSTAEPGDVARSGRRLPAAQLFRDGFLVNLLNPKTAIFFLAFLPQFIEPWRGHIASQVLVLGLIFTGLGLVSDSCYALAASSTGHLLKRSRAYLGIERYVNGGILILLGLTAALAGGNQRK